MKALAPLSPASSSPSSLPRPRHRLRQQGPAAAFTLWAAYVCLMAIGSLNVRAANDLYWDTNGPTAGTGATAGTWGTSNFWNTDSAGLAGTFQSTTSSINDLHFSAGTNGVAGTITVSGTQFANGLYFEEEAVTLSGGTISLTNGAVINTTAPTGLPTISSALYTTGTVTLTGSRLWLDTASFTGGGTLNVNTSNATLLKNGNALNGLSVININSGGLDIRTSSNGYNYAAGTTLNFVNSATLNTNLPQSVNWLGNITVSSANTATFSSLVAGSVLTLSGNISGAGSISVNGSGSTVLTGTNTYAGNTSISGTTLRITGGSALPNTTIVSFAGSVANSLDVQASETIGGLSSGTVAFSTVNLGTGQTLTLTSGTQTYSGTFTGTGRLAVAGATQTLASPVTLADLSVSSGTLTLSSANTITNGLSMSGGLVQLLNAGAAGSSPITATGGTLRLSTTRGTTLSLPNAITVSAGSRVILSGQSSGGSSGTATVEFAGTLTVNSGGLLQLTAPGSNAAYGPGNCALVFGAGAVEGTKFQLNGASFTVAGLSTNGTTPGAPVVENGSATAATLTVALPAAGTSVYAGTLRNGATGTGTLGLTVSGAADSTLTLTNANTHSGNTTVTSGSLILAHRLALQNSTVATGGTGIVFAASVASHTFTFGGLAGTTDLALQDSAGNAVTLTVGGNNTAQTYTGALSGTGALTKTGTGLLTLGGTSTYTGPTTINSGELRLEFSTAGAPLTNIISASSALVLGGGQLGQRQGSVAGPYNQQTFNGLTVKSGSSVVNQVRAPSGSMLLTLGAITREAGGTVAFSANGGGTSGIAATGTNTASGIIGGWATYFTNNGGATFTNTTDWATYSSGKIVALAPGSYTAATSATTATTNLDMTSSVALNAGVTVGSVRFNNPVATPTLTLNGTPTVGSGGILVTGNVAANASLITGGSITSGNGQDLIIIQNNTNAAGALTVDATITGNIGLTKSGLGQLILTGTNTYTGDTYLNGGTTTISSNASLGAVATGSAVHLNGGTLSTTATLALDNAGSSARAIVVDSNGGTLDVATGTTLTVSGPLSGEGALSKTGTGTLLVTGTTSTQTGTTTVTAGTLQVGVSGTGQTGPGALVLNGTGVVLAGTGIIQGPVTVTTGTLRPGDSAGASIGTLTTGELIFTPATATTVAELQITGSAGSGTLMNDKIAINGALTLNGSSNITVTATGYTPTLGDSFVLLDWSGVLDTGTTSVFSAGTSQRTGANGAEEGNLDLPDLTSFGLGWDILNFTGTGSLTIVVVPEPARALLIFAGLTLLGLRRKRP